MTQLCLKIQVSSNPRYMRVRKINYPNLVVKTKEKQEARLARVKKVFIVYRDTHGQVFSWDNGATQNVGVHNL